MSNMVKQYEKVRAFKCYCREFPELGNVIVFTYNYGEARYAAKEIFKDINPTVRYMSIRAGIVLNEVPEELNTKVCFNETHEGYNLVSEFLKTNKKGGQEYVEQVRY